MTAMQVYACLCGVSSFSGDRAPLVKACVRCKGALAPVRKWFTRASIASMPDLGPPIPDPEDPVVIGFDADDRFYAGFPTKLEVGATITLEQVLHAAARMETHGAARVFDAGIADRARAAFIAPSPRDAAVHRAIGAMQRSDRARPAHWA